MGFLNFTVRFAKQVFKKSSETGSIICQKAQNSSCMMHMAILIFFKINSEETFGISNKLEEIYYTHSVRFYRMHDCYNSSEMKYSYLCV